MADSNDIRALKFYFTETNESEIKTVLSIQCIKAQSALIIKLKKHAVHQKEICNLISIGNEKLNAEIKFAEQEITNLIISLNTIKCGNIDLRKELLLKKEQKSEILKRIELGNKKYEDLWQSSKSRYENIPYVQKCLQGRNEIRLMERNINDLQKESANLIVNINNKRNAIITTDKKLVIDLAKFLVIEQPKVIKMIHVTINEIQELSKKLNYLEEQTVLKNHLTQFKTVNIRSNAYIEETTHEMDVDDSFSKNNNEEMVMLKPHLLGADFDILGVKLERIKKGDFYKEQCKATVTELNKTKDLVCARKDEHVLTNYSNTSIFAKQHKNINYSKRKLIHILDNVELDNNQSQKIISKVNPFHLYEVNFITSEANKFDRSLENKVNESSEDKTEIDLNTGTEILVLPTQLLDEKQNSQEKKKVTFEESMETIAYEYAEGQNNQSNNIIVKEINEANNSQDDNSIGDDDHIKMKDKILKEHRLDSSPQFVYAKHSMLQKKSDDKVITSKFFNFKCDNVSKNNVEIEERQKTEEEQVQEHKVIDSSKISVNNVSTEKTNQEMHKREIPITGFLFSHGSQGILESLNLSDSTTGFEDGDYPHCLDSSVLLSPKGDVPVEMGNDNIQNEHQEVPNFMSGLRKAASLFRWSSTDCKPSTSTDKTNENFNFNFNSEEKKKRGELFSMFHK